jgi:enoyl-CoA hydratase
VTSGLAIERRGAAVWLTIDRPARRNALDDDTHAELSRALLACGEDDEVVAIVVTGAGEQAFCAGIDLKERADLDQDGEAMASPFRRPVRQVCEVMLETMKPTIAVLNGPAVGLGCELALCCDLRLAADHAYLALPEARRGLAATVGSAVLPRVLPRAVALEMLYTGERLTPVRALELGLLNAVHPAAELEEKAIDLVSRIVVNAPLSLRRIKHVAAQTWDLPLATTLRLDVGPDPYGSKDREEGIGAFLEGRPPQWRGR